MSDRVKSIDDEVQDRSVLNVAGRITKNKIVIVSIFIFLSATVLFAGIYLTALNIKNISSESQDGEQYNNYIAGASNSRLDDAKNYFSSLKKEKERKRELEDLFNKSRDEDINAQKESSNDEYVRKDNQDISEATSVIESQSESNVSYQPIPTYENDQEVMTPAQRKLQGSATLSSKNSPPNIDTSSNEYSDSFKASSYKDGTATIREKGLDFLLAHGTTLPCALYTQIISDYEGFVTCRITQDIYSANGATLLVERGSLVSGNQNVALEQGKARIFTTWSDIETPLGVRIKIDSLGAGQLGASGIDSWVDNHFGERFGGAILLSLIDDSLAALKDNVAENSSTSIDNSTSNASNMASKALDSSINIKPTGYAFIGQKINILVVRDIDMSDVYKLRRM